MAEKRITWKRTQRLLKQLRLSDWFLLFFMVMLMGQSAYTLLICDCITEAPGSLDAVIRTTMAGIFGYFISAGFLHRKPEQPAPTENASVRATGGDFASTPSTKSGGPVAIIGFTADQNEGVGASQQYGRTEDTASLSVSQQAASQERKNRRRIRQQIVIVGLIGISSMIILFMTKGMSEATPSAIAAISQFRDFVSGSVGLLIGHSTREPD